MNATATPARPGLSLLKSLLALSRTPHGLLDMATPAFAALLWHGTFPAPQIILLGLLTAFAGYTAVYALNDLVDYRVDKHRYDQGLFADCREDLDGIFVRHPLASGLLSLRQAGFWTAAWAVIAFAGAFLLNPLCALVFLGGCLLETIYCLLWQSTCLKFFISGGVKTCGALAAVFAVDPHPSPLPLFVLLFCLFCWEIGGQNLPNDWADIEEDRQLQANTIPLRFGPALANTLILLSLFTAVAMNGFILGFILARGRLVGVAASLFIGAYLLLLPAYRLSKTGKRRQALVLFNRASYYPAALLAVVIVTIIV